MDKKILEQLLSFVVEVSIELKKYTTHDNKLYYNGQTKQFFGEDQLKLHILEQLMKKADKK